MNEEKLVQLYEESDPELKKKLIDIYGEDYFPKKTIESVKTLDDAFRICNISESEKLEIEKIVSIDEKSYRELKIITKALNGDDWEADYTDSNQKKWTPWFSSSASGFAFQGSLYDYSGTYAFLGARLCFKSKEISDYAGKQFLQTYKSFLT